MIESEQALAGEKLAPGEEFNFQCSPELACFNTCCWNKRLPLYPYDMLRLRLGMNLPSQEILARVVELEFDPVSGWPALRLKLTDEGACPLLTPEGCSVYEHRPAACRIYPLGRAAQPGVGGGPARVIYLRQHTKGCLGWDQPRTHKVADWIRDQGLEPYNRANDSAMELFLHPGRKGRLKLSEPQIHAVIAALYNLDVFRKNACEPGFARRFGLDEALAGRAVHDDDALLELGQRWLTAQLFGEA